MIMIQEVVAIGNLDIIDKHCFRKGIRKEI